MRVCQRYPIRRFALCRSVVWRAASSCEVRRGDDVRCRTGTFDWDCAKFPMMTEPAEGYLTRSTPEYPRSTKSPEGNRAVSQRPRMPRLVGRLGWYLGLVYLGTSVLTTYLGTSVLRYHVLRYHVLRYHVLWYHVLWYHVLWYHVLRYHGLRFYDVFGPHGPFGKNTCFGIRARSAHCRPRPKNRPTHASQRRKHFAFATGGAVQSDLANAAASQHPMQHQLPFATSSA
jgi:hypothetical protein